MSFIPTEEEKQVFEKYHNDRHSANYIDLWQTSAFTPITITIDELKTLDNFIDDEYHCYSRLTRDFIMGMDEAERNVSPVFNYVLKKMISICQKRDLEIFDAGELHNRLVQFLSSGEEKHIIDVIIKHYGLDYILNYVSTEFPKSYVSEDVHKLRRISSL